VTILWTSSTAEAEDDAAASAEPAASATSIT
jgi:hypothetical protein